MLTAVMSCSVRYFSLFKRKTHKLLMTCVAPACTHLKVRRQKMSMNNLLVSQQNILRHFDKRFLCHFFCRKVHLQILMLHKSTVIQAVCVSIIPGLAVINDIPMINGVGRGAHKRQSDVTFSKWRPHTLLTVAAFLIGSIQ